MIHQLREKIRETIAKLERIKTIEVLMEDITIDISDLKKEEQNLWNNLKKEEADVERLQRISATAVFLQITGKKEKQFDKEQREAYEARLKYDAIVYQLEDFERRLQQLQEERASLLDCQKEYQELFKQLHAALKSSSQHADDLITLELQYGKITNQIKEIEEAKSVGQSILEVIAGIKDDLGSAKGWGTWDMLGGGVVSSLAKHSHLNSAQRKVETMQILLNQFKNELADVERVSTVENVTIGAFTKFADYVFDGFFVDWFVLSKISNFLKQVEEMEYQIDDIVQYLIDLKVKQNHEKDVLRTKITDFIINA